MTDEFLYCELERAWKAAEAVVGTGAALGEEKAVRTLRRDSRTETALRNRWQGCFKAVRCAIQPSY
jgi:hypothetical protein